MTVLITGTMVVILGNIDALVGEIGVLFSLLYYNDTKEEKEEEELLLLNNVIIDQLDL